MILYNQDRKLIAIDNELVDFLGFGSLDELKNSVNDIAELFEKKPGYIYNFKNFSWINYILSNPSKEHKAIINLQENSIEVKISIHILISWDNDSARYFLIDLSPIDVNLNNKNFNGSFFEENIEAKQENKAPKETYLNQNKKEKESLNINLDELLEKPEKEISSTPEAKPEKESLNIDLDQLLKESETEKEESEEPKEIEFVSPVETKEEEIHIDLDNLLKENEDREESIETQEEKTKLAPASEEKSLAIDLDQLLKESETEKEESEEPKEIKFVSPAETKEEEIHYDYKKVSNELEIDEEFLKELVKEFIEQSENLKAKIEKSLKEKNMEEAHSLFHRIKGAAANLRIEKANNILSKTRGEDDSNKLKEISKEFYDFLEKFKKYILGQKIEKNEHTKENPIENQEIQEEKRDYEKELFTPYDIENAKKDLGLSKDVILGFINDYIQDSRKQKDRLNELIEEKNIEELKNVIHKLKGSAANLHIEKIVEILNYIRNKIDKNNFNDIKKDIDNFFKYLSYLENELNNLKNNEYKKELKKSSAKLGLNINSYDKFVKEYLNELKTLLQEDEKKIKKDTIKYKSMAENLRLEKIAKILNKLSKEKDIKTSISELAKTTDDIAKEIS